MTPRLQRIAAIVNLTGVIPVAKDTQCLKQAFVVEGAAGWQRRAVLRILGKNFVAMAAVSDQNRQVFLGGKDGSLLVLR